MRSRLPGMYLAMSASYVLVFMSLLIFLNFWLALSKSDAALSTASDLPMLSRDETVFFHFYSFFKYSQIFFIFFSFTVYFVFSLLLLFCRFAALSPHLLLPRFLVHYLFLPYILFLLFFYFCFILIFLFGFF